MREEARRNEGTTSACAENTSGTGTCPPWVRNYLRVRGEYAIGYASLPITVELPPRARRIHTSYSPNRFLYGTTSACAENTQPTGDPHHDQWNYLRVRGEYKPLVS